MYMSSYADKRNLLSYGICPGYGHAAPAEQEGERKSTKVEPAQTKKAAARRRPLAEGNRRRLFLDLARTDLTGPLARRCGTVLDELLEALEIVLDAEAVASKKIPQALVRR